MNTLHQWEPAVCLTQRKSLKLALLRGGPLRLLFDAHQFRRPTRRKSDAFGQRHIRLNNPVIALALRDARLGCATFSTWPSALRVQLVVRPPCSVRVLRWWPVSQL